MNSNIIDDGSAVVSFNVIIPRPKHNTSILGSILNGRKDLRSEISSTNIETASGEAGNPKKTILVLLLFAIHLFHEFSRRSMLPLLPNSHCGLL